MNILVRKPAGRCRSWRSRPIAPPIRAATIRRMMVDDTTTLNSERKSWVVCSNTGIGRGEPERDECTPGKSPPTWFLRRTVNAAGYPSRPWFRRDAEKPSFSSCDPSAGAVDGRRWLAFDGDPRQNWQRLAAHGVGNWVAIDGDHIVDASGGIAERTLPQSLGIEGLDPDAVIAFVD